MNVTTLEKLTFKHLVYSACPAKCYISIINRGYLLIDDIQDFCRSLSVGHITSERD